MAAQEVDALCVKVKAERDYFKGKCSELKLKARPHADTTLRWLH
jgi:hypothetical protein